MELNFKSIPQNSRTIIFERFNDQKPNFCTLLKGQQPGDVLDKINKEICVKSFEEFKEKFNPTVYEIFRVDEESGELSVTYSTECEHQQANVISLCEHEFYKAVHDIAKTKSASNLNNNEIDYTKLYEALDPKLIYARARRRRDEVRQYYVNAIEAQDNGNPDGAREWTNKANKVFNDVRNEYSGSALRMLPIAVRDIDIILESKGITDENQGMIEDGATQHKMLPCTVEWGENGDLKIIKLEEKQTDALAITQKDDRVLKLTQQKWGQIADKMPAGSVDRNLFLSVYSEKDNSALTKLSTEQLMARKKIYGDMYVAAQQSFCKAVGSLVRRVANVEQFFIHAGDEKGVIESGVIIANCSVADVIDNEENVKNYFDIASNSEKDRIWFAVLPSASDKEKKWRNTVSSRPFDLFSDFDTDTEEMNDSGEATVTVADINIISSMLSQYGIMSFFNFTACEETSFKNFGVNTEIIDEYNKEVESIKATDSVVLAYPNFTIIPKEKRQVEMVNGNKLYTPAVYIDAAYVAAGIVVATQNAKIQKMKFGKRVEDGKPFMRFDLENEENNQAFIAQFNPESRINMGKEVVSYLRGKNGNAFCFRSDSGEKNAFVFTARTLDAKPIYQQITCQYFTFLLERTYTKGSLSSGNANEFANAVSNIVNNPTGDDVVNPLLKQGEKFEYNDQTESFSLKFNGVDEPLKIKVDIL